MLGFPLKGGYSGGCVPIGYQYTKGNKAWSVDSEKVDTVKRVFQLREIESGITLQVIADTLNKEGFTTARGAKFQRVQIKRILDRKFVYTGKYIYADIESAGQHPPILQK